MVSSRLRKKKRKLPRGPVDGVAPTSVSDEFFNRELSWLEFNRRVLAQAQSASMPLLERLRFLTIFTSNLDEFFQSRVGSIQQRLELSSPNSPWRTGFEQQLKEIRGAVLELCRVQDSVLSEQLRPALRDNGIHLLKWQDLSTSERSIATRLFHDTIFPVLTPLAVDPGHPFPFISNLSLSLGVLLKQPDHDEELFARVKVPSVLPQLVKVGESEHVGEVRVLSLTELIRHNLHELFPGMMVQGVLPFRITRNSEMEVDLEDGEDIVELISQGLKERKFASVVRLEVAPNPDPSILRCLMEELALQPEDVFVSESAM
jgi:polyphosphate kinase